MNSFVWKEYLSKFNVLKHPARKVFGAFEFPAITGNDEISRSESLPESSSTLVQSQRTKVMPQYPFNRRAGASASSDNLKNINIFGSTLVIDGSVTAESDIVVQGVIRGNVTSSGNIEVLGEVKGNLTGKTIRVAQGKITGNIQATEEVSIYNSTVTGDIFSQEAQIDSAINGNITVSGTLFIKKSSVIKGNVTAAGLSVEENALLEGKVVVSRSKQAAVSQPVEEVPPIE